MRRNSFFTFLKEKSFIIVLTLMLVSAGTMAALFALGGEEPQEQNQVAQREETVQKVPSADVNPEKEREAEGESAPKRTAVVTKKTDTKEKKEQNTAAAAQAAGENAVLEAELEDQYVQNEEMAEVSADDIVAEGFSEADLLSLKWPVEGEVLMPFSMDHSIYFPTLAQYQYNPAMIISVSEGTEVLTAAEGTVTDVGKNDVYGHYVTMDIGDGFEITYGQLFDISTEVGEILEAGERIAMVAYPTRSYSEEGENLYFKLTQDGVPVDPALYLEK